MRVLVISSKYPPEYAGSGLRAHNTYRRLARRYGVSFDVLTSSEEFNGLGRYRHDGVDVLRIALKTGVQISPRQGAGRWRRWLLKLANHLFYTLHYWCEAVATMAVLIRRAPRYDVLHVFGKNNITSAALIYATLFRKPVIVEFVNRSGTPHQYVPWVVRCFLGNRLPRHALIVCISEYLKEVCVRHGYPERQLWCRPNPVDEMKFNVIPWDGLRSAKDGYGFRDGEKVVLQLAKFMPLKNQLFLIDVLQYLPEGFRLFLAGPRVQGGALNARDENYYKLVLDRIQKRGLAHRVCLYPVFVEEPGRLMRMADVVVLPSTSEAFGTPFMEAMACGVPVVTNDIPGVFDRWITPGEDGFVCPLDPERWADCIVKAAAIDSEKMQLASRRVLERASTARIDEQYYDHLRRLAGQTEK